MRPYTYAGTVDEGFAPGAQTRNGATVCAVDLAWRLEPIFGAPRHAAAHWPGVAGAADAARALGEAKGLTALQQIGAAFLAERDFAALLDPTGAGKTAQALIAAESRLSLGIAPPEAGAVLVICPALAKWHWQREIARWTGHKSVVIEGLRPEPEQLDGMRYVIANYDILAAARRRDAAGVAHTLVDLPGWGTTLRDRRYVIVVCDESHNLRGRDSKRTAAVRELTRPSVAVWMLSATPMPNYLRDLWAQLDVMTDGLHGPYWAWARAYCNAKQGTYGWIDTGTDTQRVGELRSRLAYYMLGRTKAEVQASWPEKRREVYPVDVKAPPKEVVDVITEKEKRDQLDTALRETARLKRPAAIEQAVDAVNAGQKVVVFVYLREQAEAISKGIEKMLKREKAIRPIYTATGDHTAQARDAMAQEFRECEGSAAFVATIDSVGVAISLVGADLVIFADLLYEAWKLIQAEGRCHRHDSVNGVIVRYLIARDTIDDALEQSVVSKLKNIEAALGTDPDNAALETLIGTNQTDGATLIDRLFSRLQAWSSDEET